MERMLFSEAHIGALRLRNRIVRSATYEGAAEHDGAPGDAYLRMYEELASHEIGLLITGFAFISRTGRAMQPRQAGIDRDERIGEFRRVTDAVHRHGTPIVLQIAHAGRQTLRSATSAVPVSTTRRRSLYFRQKPRLLDASEARSIADEFAAAAGRAQRAGFDGVQLHAAHGYLLHQFINGNVNRLRNEFGINRETGIGTAFLGLVIDQVRARCGDAFPVLVKISADTDGHPSFFPEHFDHLIAWLHKQQLSAIEISYGTMDCAMNIFRGATPLDLVLRHNPLFTTESLFERAAWRLLLRHVIIPRQIPFSATYNLAAAERARMLTDIPIISVGGFRTRREMDAAITGGKTDFISMSRPFLREPGFVERLMREDDDCSSLCENCNRCVALCDAGHVTACHRRHIHASVDSTMRNPS